MKLTEAQPLGSAPSLPLRTSTAGSVRKGVSLGGSFAPQVEVRKPTDSDQVVAIANSQETHTLQTSANRPEQ